jgi:hypothetical protein
VDHAQTIKDNLIDSSGCKPTLFLIFSLDDDANDSSVGRRSDRNVGGRAGGAVAAARRVQLDDPGLEMAVKALTDNFAINVVAREYGGEASEGMGPAAAAFAEVEHHESAYGVQFDWIVRCRFDEVWYAPVAAFAALESGKAYGVQDQELGAGASFAVVARELGDSLFDGGGGGGCSEKEGKAGVCAATRQANGRGRPKTTQDLAANGGSRGFRGTGLTPLVQLYVIV